MYLSDSERAYNEKIDLAFQWSRECCYQKQFVEQKYQELLSATKYIVELSQSFELDYAQARTIRLLIDRTHVHYRLGYLERILFSLSSSSRMLMPTVKNNEESLKRRHAFYIGQYLQVLKRRRF